jgi:UDP-3-O-[3-hydroxymyristoyl] N-acetylglucosamine deacetylase / 3-hydroxyacyl-[acyl-carrier-protein] dehydratase
VQRQRMGRGKPVWAKTQPPPLAKSGGGRLHRAMAVTRQTTIAEPQSLSGMALHTGTKVTVTVRPAAADTGFVFKRLDLPDEPTIRAHIDHVKQVERATTIGEGQAKVQTIEHLLSALRGTGIDNCLIEIDANEAPILDGSARPFVEMLQKAGRKELSESVKSFEVREPVKVEGRDGAYMIAWPADTFRVTCTNANHTGRHTQYYQWEYNPETYGKEIAPARTFVFYEEVQPLMEKGLIKGGSLENAVVIKGDAVLGREPLRFPDEFVRHKILDIIADLSLFPLRLKAHIFAAKPSHALNVELAKAIQKQYSKFIAQLMPVENVPVGDSGMDIVEVMKVLPHRYPFLLVDKILYFEEAVKAIGQKTVTINEPYFQGHFPGHPIMPGVLQIEAMAQVASILMLKSAKNAGKLGYFMSVDKAKFRKPVLPGDVLIIHAELTKARGNIARANGQCLVNNEVVSEAELMFVLVDV